MKTALACVAGAAALALLVDTAIAVGGIDATFGNQGRLLLDFGDDDERAAAALLTEEGKIVLVGFSGGRFAAARIESNGKLDRSFGDTGRSAVEFEARALAASGLISSDGKVIAGGIVGEDFGIAQLNADGKLDTTFGDGGRVITRFDRGSGLTSLARYPDRKIVAAGTAQSCRSPGDCHTVFALVRYLPDGRLDPIFGQGGKVTAALAGTLEGNDQIRQIAIDGEENIVAAGAHKAGEGSVDTILARFKPDGSLDASFGQGGVVIVGLGEGVDDSASALRIQPDGKILVGGYIATSQRPFTRFALARFNFDGSADSGFGDGGKLTGPIDGRIADLALLENEGILAVGNAFTADPISHFAIARYNGNGTLDESFGVGGRILGPFDGSPAAIVLQSQELAIVAGSHLQGGGRDFAVTRYRLEDSGPTADPQEPSRASDDSGEGGNSSEEAASSGLLGGSIVALIVIALVLIALITSLILRTRRRRSSV